MSRDIAEEIKQIQKSMVDGSSEAFMASDLGDLKVLIRLAVEYAAFLEEPRVRKDFVFDEAEYMRGSVFGGLECFMGVVTLYRLLGGAHPSTLDWTTLAPKRLGDEYLIQFSRFLEEQNVQEKWRLLLDLFKLQLVLTAMSYEG